MCFSRLDVGGPHSPSHIRKTIEPFTPAIKLAAVVGLLAGRVPWITGPSILAQVAMGSR